jgi:hypothetical protein
LSENAGGQGTDAVFLQAYASVACLDPGMPAIKMKEQTLINQNQKNVSEVGLPPVWPAEDFSRN